MYGEDPELYERVRPGYPEELIDDVVALVGDRSGAVDAGRGTGKAAVLLGGVEACDQHTDGIRAYVSVWWVTGRSPARHSAQP